MRIAFACLAWLLGCAAALAGPWPRETGSSFLSFSLEAPHDGDTKDFYYSLYAEYGLSPRLTIGFDGGSDYYTQGEGYVFLRTPVPLETGRHQFALLGGVGARQTVTSFAEAVFVLGGSWGTGFDTALGNGWATIDATIRDRQTTGTRLTKIDTTIGVNHNTQLWFTQLRYADESAAPEPSWEVAPSVAFTLGGRTRLETSAAFGLQGPKDVTLKIGIWTEF